jgi:hypothetical protein
MSADLKSNLANHFKEISDAKAKVVQAAVDRAEQAEQKRQEFLRSVQQMIAPAFTEARNILLENNHPAEVVAHDNKESGEAYIGLHFSNEPNQRQGLKEHPKFFIKYHYSRGAVELASSGLKCDKYPTGPLKAKRALGDITKEEVDTTVLGTIQFSIPAV